MLLENRLWKWPIEPRAQKKLSISEIPKILTPLLLRLKPSLARMRLQHRTAAPSGAMRIPASPSCDGCSCRESLEPLSAPTGLCATAFSSIGGPASSVVPSPLTGNLWSCNPCKTCRSHPARPGASGRRTTPSASPARTWGNVWQLLL